MKDKELEQVLEDIPRLSIGSYRKDLMMRAHVYIDGSGRLNVLPESGGWLGADREHLQADITPFAD